MSEIKEQSPSRKDYWVRAIQNTAGELEQETKTRKSNLIEFFATMTLILVTLWLMAYPAILLDIDWLNTLAIVILVVGAIILILIGPNIHKDEFHGWGLGNPIALYHYIQDSSKKRKLMLISIISLLVIGLTLAAFIFWTEVAGFVGINEADALAFRDGPGGAAAVIGIGVAVSLLFATVIVRYDNFLSALDIAFRIIIPLAVLMLMLGPLMNGLGVLFAFNALSFILNVFGYVFWGVIQQLLFSSYFGTRVRKGFGPEEDPKKAKRKRFWVAFLNGSFFGLLHIPSWYLLGITWFLGIILSYVFMEDKNRNLLALGFIHGVLGSMLGWLFSSGSSGSSGGGVNIEMTVGPWSMDTFDISIFIVVGILVALFIVAIIYIYKKWED